MKKFAYCTSFLQKDENKEDENGLMSALLSVLGNRKSFEKVSDEPSTTGSSPFRNKSSDTFGGHDRSEILSALHSDNSNGEVYGRASSPLGEEKTDTAPNAESCETHKSGIYENAENSTKKADKNKNGEADYYSPPPYYIR